ncbi:MAG: GAF domain-containing protein [Anaerolineae bacterium]|nr:GAF domain-containing protein [Anaerolineae bacterium]
MSVATQLQQEVVQLKEAYHALEQENQVLHRYLDTVQELYWAGQEIASAENLLYELNQLLYKVMSVVGAKDGSISRMDEGSDELVFALVHGELGQQLPDYRIKSDAGIAGWVVRNRRPIIVNEPRQDPRFSQIVDKEFGFFTKSIVSAPMMRLGRLLGVVQLLNKRDDGQFNQADVVLLLVLGQVAAIVFEEMKARRKSETFEEDDILAPL